MPFQPPRLDDEWDYFWSWWEDSLKTFEPELLALIIKDAAVQVDKKLEARAGHQR